MLRWFWAYMHYLRSLITGLNLGNKEFKISSNQLTLTKEITNDSI